MTRRRLQHDPVIWLIFAVAVAVPSLELMRLRRARDIAPRAAPAESPRVLQTGQPEVAPPPGPPAPPRDFAPAKDSRAAAPPGPTPVTSVDPSRYVAVGPTRTPIVASVLAPTGNAAAVLEESGRVTVWNIDLHTKLGSFASGLPARDSQITPPIALVAPLDYGTRAIRPFIAVGGADGRVHVWHAVNGTKEFTSPQSVGDTSYNPNRKLRVVDVMWDGPAIVGRVGNDGTYAGWYINTPPLSAYAHTPRCPGGDFKDVDFSSESRVIAAGCAGGVYLRKDLDHAWTLVDTSSGAHPGRVVFSRDGGLVAVAWSDGQIRVYAAPIPSGWEKGMRVYSTAPPTRVRTMRFAKGVAPRLLAFSPDAKLLAASGDGRAIYVWSMTPGTAPVALTVPRGPVRSMWFAPQGHTVVVAGNGDRYLRALPVAIDR